MSMNHLREIALESGVDFDEDSATSRERHISLPDWPEPVATWYQECATWQPWRAFIAGAGEGSGWSAREAAADAVRKARERGLRHVPAAHG